MLLMDWIKLSKMNQREFTNLLLEKFPETNANEVKTSNWARGKVFPNAGTILAIQKVTDGRVNLEDIVEGRRLWIEEQERLSGLKGQMEE